jgi:hypothetical protein
LKAVWLLALLVSLVSCGQPQGPNAVRQGDAFYARLVAEPSDVPFAIGDLTEFKWDHLWVFPGYTPGYAIDREVGTWVDYAHSSEGSIETDSIHSMFVFKAGKRVVAVTDVDTRTLRVQSLAYLEPPQTKYVPIVPSDRFVKRESTGDPPRVLRYP